MKIILPKSQRTWWQWGSWLRNAVNTVFEKHIVLESLDRKFLSGS